MARTTALPRKTVRTIARADLRATLEGTNGKFFTVSFVKRTDGKVRVMPATINIAPYVTGGDAKYDAAAKGLLVVADRDAIALRDATAKLNTLTGDDRVLPNPIRSIGLESVFEVKIGRLTYTVTD